MYLDWIVLYVFTSCCVSAVFTLGYWFGLKAKPTGKGITK